MLLRPARLWLLLVVWGSAVDASAESFSPQPDPLYAYRDAGPPAPNASHVRAIVYPTMGLPALAGYGGELDIVLRAETRTTRPRDWKLRLVTRANPGALPFPLEILAVAHDDDLALTKLHVRIPARAPRGTYDLEVVGPSLRDTQPNAVRIYGVVRPEYRFAVLADHQLWDPSWRIHDPDRSARDWPRRGEGEDNRAMARQQLAELAFLDPDFVVHAGDLMFGLDYAQEYAEAWRFWQEAQVATFMLPGNHDGYATYGVELDGAPLRLAAGLVACRHLVQTPLDWPRAFALLECVYGDVKAALFSHFLRDGLSYWRRTFGPSYYAWEYGDLHFVALNTYDGSPARRHSYALYVDALDLHLGAPAVDNYGGSLSDEQLRWLADDLERASRAGKTVVVIGHHDPRGNLSVPAGDRYQANQPFPTRPFGLSPLQEWNYDGEGWSSERTGERGEESPTRNSGTRLLGLLAAHASYYIAGHAHRDEHQRYAAGEAIAPSIRARHALTFLRVTTASGAPSSPSAYWGYWVIAVRGRQLAIEPYDGAHQLESMPSGNLWTEAKSPTEQWVVSGLPQPTVGIVRFHLPERPGGWRFVDVATQVEASLLDVHPAAGKGKQATWIVEVHSAPADAAVFPVRPGAQSRRLYQAQPAKRNRPPIPALTIHGPGGDGEPITDAGRICAGDTVELDAQATRDPDGDGILMTIITTPDGKEARASSVRWTFARAGRYRLTVEAMDTHGARARRQLSLRVAPRRLKDGRWSCGQRSSSQ